MYSLMSKRRKGTVSRWASCFANSVFPTPVGPENRKEPMGFSWPRSPERLSLMLEATFSMAASWPKITARSCPSRSASRDRSSPLSSAGAPGPSWPRPLRCPRHPAFFSASGRQQFLGGAGFVQHVDGLVRQVQIPQVAGGEAHGGVQGRIAEADPMVVFEERAQSLQDVQGFGLGGLADIHLLEAPGERASLSKECLASRNVVAPMQRSSPAARAGLSKLEASRLPPLTEPAPTMVWISSMNSSAWSLAFNASMTALTRCSKSPR